MATEKSEGLAFERNGFKLESSYFSPAVDNEAVSGQISRSFITHGNMHELTRIGSSNSNLEICYACANNRQHIDNDGEVQQTMIRGGRAISVSTPDVSRPANEVSSNFCTVLSCTATTSSGSSRYADTGHMMMCQSLLTECFDTSLRRLASCMIGMQVPRGST